jgi:hypothetical protein
MKLLIRDYFHRWKWIYVPVGLIHVAICMHAVWTKEIGTLFQFVMYAGVFLLYLDLQRGGTRVITTLPLSNKQIAQAWWLMSVGIPAAGIIVLGFLSAGLSVGLAFLGHASGEFYFSSVALICLTDILWLGSMFFLLTCMPGPFGSDWWSKTRGMLFGSLWGFSFGGWMFFAQYLNRSPRDVVIILVICGFLMSVAGWFRAEQLVGQRAGFRPAWQRARKRPAKYEISQGFNGISLLITKVITNALLMGVYLVAFMALFAFLEGDLKSVAQFIHSFFLTTSGGFPLWMIIAFSMFPFFSQLRLLRTLPLSTIKLAILLVFLPVISTLAIGASWMAVVFSTSNSAQCLALAGTFLLLSAGAAVCVPITVCLGYRLQAKMIVFLFLGVCVSITLSQLIGVKFSFSLLAAIWICIVMVSCFFTKLALTRSDNAYRTWPNSPGVGWGNWGGNWGR